MNILQKVYTGIRGQVHKAINKALAMYDTSFETYESDVVAAKEADHREFLKTGVRRHTAMRVASSPRWAFRKAVKEVMVQRSLAKVNDGKGGTMNAINELVKLHSALRFALMRVAAKVIRWDGFTTDFPLWEVWTPVGEDERGEMVFEKDELWTKDEFITFITKGNKFSKDLAKWTIEFQLRDIPTPKFELPDSEIAFQFEEAMHTAMDRKAERDAKAGKQIYTYGMFYTEGLKVEHIGDGEMGVTSIFANIGRMVSVHNRVVANLGYQIGQMLYGQKSRAGMESGDSQRELMGYTISTTTTQNEDERFISEDEEWKALQLDVANLQQAIMEYVVKWQRILPPKQMKLVDAYYHGGYEYMGTTLDDEGKPKLDKQGNEVMRFTLKKFELVDPEAYMSEDSYKAALERRMAYAIEKDLEELKNFQPETLTF